MAVLHRKPLLVSQLGELENRLGFLLPIEYRQFLMEYNGIFITEPDYFDIPFNKVDNKEIAFAALYGYGAKSKNLDLIAMNDELGDELGFMVNPFVIGDDGGDNFYVFALQNQKQQVFYWDRTHLHAEDEMKGFDVAEVDDCGNLYLVADSFSEFFNAIYSNIRSAEFIENDD